MWCQDEYKEGIKAYRKGFAWGAFTGLIGWLVIGKVIFTLPIVLGLFFGGFALQLRIKQLTKNNK